MIAVIDVKDCHMKEELDYFVGYLEHSTLVFHRNT